MKCFQSIAFILALSFMLVSCAVPGPGRVYAQFPPKPDPNQVQIVYAKPSRDYVLIADFEVMNASNKSIQKRAAQYGADAVFVANYSVSFIGASGDLNSSTKTSGINNHSFCSAIKYK